MKIFHPNSIDKNIPFLSKTNFKSQSKSSKLPEIPVLSATLKFSDQFDNNFSTDELIKTAFNSKASCAIALTLFRWLDIYPNEQSAVALEENTPLSSISNDVLYHAVIDAIRHPPCIVKAVSEYIQEVFSGQRYIGIHWRYDKNDFTKLCQLPWVKFYCENMHKIQPKELAHGIISLMDKVDKSPIPIYIASPPSLESFVNKVYDELEKLYNRAVKPSVKLRDFLSSKYNICWEDAGWKVTENIFSLCESEILINSFWFLFSYPSTWSQMIRPFRTNTYGNGTIGKRFETNVFRLALSAYEASNKQEK